MKTTRALSLTTFASILMAMPALSGATGVLSITSKTFNLPGAGWTTYASGGYTYASLSAGALAGGATASSTQNKVGSIDVAFQYVCPNADTPPSSVTLTYDAKMTGSLGYALLGRTPPSGSASGDFTGSVTKAGATATSITSSFGPVAQATTTLTSSIPDTVMNVSNQILSVSSWSPHDNGDGTTTYTTSVTILNLSETANASCSVNWKGSNGRSSIGFAINISTFTAN